MFLCVCVYICVCVCVCVYIYTHTPHLLYPFFCNEYLDCLHVLAIVNSTAMDTGEHVFFLIMFFAGYMSRSGIVGSYCSSVFCFLRNLYTVLSSGFPNLHSHQQVKGFPSLCTLSTVYCLWTFFDETYSDWCEVISHCSFDLYFPNN